MNRYGLWETEANGDMYIFMERIYQVHMYYLWTKLNMEILMRQLAHLMELVDIEESVPPPHLKDCNCSIQETKVPQLSLSLSQKKKEKETKVPKQSVLYWVKWLIILHAIVPDAAHSQLSSRRTRMHACMHKSSGQGFIQKNVNRTWLLTDWQCSYYWSFYST